MGEEMHKFLVTLAELQAAVALGVSLMQVKEHPGYRRVCGAEPRRVHGYFGGAGAGAGAASHQEGGDL
jgi:hypothetical protein